MRRSRRSTRWALIGASVVAAVVGGVAWATIPNEGGVINACYLKSGGTLRLIDASVTSCKKTETAISWTAGQQRIPGPAVMDSSQYLNPMEPIKLGYGTWPNHTRIAKTALPTADPYNNGGWWAVTATVWMDNREDHAVEVACEVMSDDNVNGLGSAARIQPGRFNQVVFPSGVPGNHVNLFCGFVNPTTPGFDDEVYVQAWSILSLPSRPAPGEG